MHEMGNASFDQESRPVLGPELSDLSGVIQIGPGTARLPLREESRKNCFTFAQDAVLLSFNMGRPPRKPTCFRPGFTARNQRLSGKIGPVLVTSLNGLSRTLTAHGGAQCLLAVRSLSVF